jgi:hypothetical protein
MLRLNGFIRSNLAKVEEFFEEIASEASTVRTLLFLHSVAVSALTLPTASHARNRRKTCWSGS